VPTVRCPKCGTVNPNGRRRLSRCRSCHESLGKCRYCQHFDLRLLECSHPFRRTDERVLDADEVLNCPEFTTLLAGRLPPTGPHVARTIIVAVVLAAAVLLLAARLLRPRELPPPAALRVSVSNPESSFREDRLEFKVLVLNQSNRPARDVRVYLTGSSMKDLLCEYVDPPESFEEATPQRACAWLGPLEPGQIGTILFRFRPNCTGTLHLAAFVTASNLEVPAQTPIKCEVMP